MSELNYVGWHHYVRSHEVVVSQTEIAALRARANAAEAEVTRLRNHPTQVVALLTRIDALEADNKRLREALSTIIEEENALGIRSYGLGDIAHAALKGTA